MASLKKTKFIVATGILVCVLGLGFIAMSGSSAFSEGYGAQMTVSSLDLFSRASGECVAIKGAQICQSNQTF